MVASAARRSCAGDGRAACVVPLHEAHTIARPSVVSLTWPRHAHVGSMAPVGSTLGSVLGARCNVMSIDAFGTRGQIRTKTFGEQYLCDSHSHPRPPRSNLCPWCSHKLISCRPPLNVTNRPRVPAKQQKAEKKARVS